MSLFFKYEPTEEQKKIKMLTVGWLNTARVLAAVVLVSTPHSPGPGPLLQHVPDLWRRRSGPAAVPQSVVGALCMAHCNQQRKERYNFNRFHFFQTASAIT